MALHSGPVLLGFDKTLGLFVGYTLIQSVPEHGITAFTMLQERSLTQERFPDAGEVP